MLCKLDTASKVFERIIYQRIEAVVHSLLVNNQYRFRNEQSTLDAVNLVVDKAKKTISSTRWKKGAKEYCLAAALDIKYAFNCANRDFIMQALQKKNVPGNMCRMIAT